MKQQMNGEHSAARGGGMPTKWVAWWKSPRAARRDVPFLNPDTSEHEFENQLEGLYAILTGVERSKWDLASKITYDPHTYYDYSVQSDEDRSPTSGLTNEEAHQLRSERENLSSQKSIIVIMLTLALAAFLRGHVQSSINGGTLYADMLKVSSPDPNAAKHVSIRDWEIGVMNASPLITAAVLGAPLSLPTNYYLGRRGSLLVSSVLIIASSIGSAFCHSWQRLLAVRIIGGVGMGIKAISAPILASETASGYWRGSILLGWQLWVAFGIMIGFVVNIVIATVTGQLNIPQDSQDNGGDLESRTLTLQLILGAPFVPSVLLFIAVYFCYESPRFYMRQDSPNYDPNQALRILRKVRGCELQALRDLMSIYWSTQSREAAEGDPPVALTYASKLGKVLRLSWRQYRTLFIERRKLNAVWSACTVALSQQLCGINVFALYSSIIFVDVKRHDSVKIAMAYSLGYGAVNFVFCLPALGTIDTLGRRVWLLSTLPLMALFLVAAAIAFPAGNNFESPRSIIGVVFVFLFTAAYAPGLGPIPFTLASESFPLSHREAGASVAIAVNLFFAGVLCILLPAIKSALNTRGTLGLFAGMNVIAFILIFLIVEETRQLDLETLDKVFRRKKRHFMRYQISIQTPYFFKKYVLLQLDTEKPPSYYDEAIREADDSTEMDDLGSSSERSEQHI